MPAQIRRLRAEEKMSMEEAFPTVDWMVDPLGNNVVVQMKMPKRTAGGIILTDSDTEFDREKIRVGKVVAMGPLAYKNRDTQEDWPEGAWVKLGDYVRIPAFAHTDRWQIFIKDEAETERRRAAWRTKCADADARVAELVRNKNSADTPLTRREEKELEDLVESRKRAAEPEDVFIGVEFATFADFDLKGLVRGDPLDIVDYL